MSVFHSSFFLSMCVCKCVHVSCQDVLSFICVSCDLRASASNYNFSLFCHCSRLAMRKENEERQQILSHNLEQTISFSLEQSAYLTCYYLCRKRSSEYLRVISCLSKLMAVTFFSYLFHFCSWKKLFVPFVLNINF